MNGTEQIVEQPVVPPVVENKEPEQPKMARYEYQPTDDEGRPLGGKQVIEYTEGNQQELVDKLAKQANELIKLNRKLKRDRELGMEEQPSISDDEAGLEKAGQDIRPLTASERLQLTKDLLDPEKCVAASDRLLEASPRFLQVVKEATVQRAINEAQAFAVEHPDFYPGIENRKALVQWCVKRNAALTKKNFEVAFKQLKSAGLLTEAPIAAEETPAKSQPETDTPETRISQPEPSPAKRPVITSSGLTRSNSSESRGGGVPKAKLTWAEVDRMPASEYERKMRDPEFRKQLDALPRR